MTTILGLSIIFLIIIILFQISNASDMIAFLKGEEKSMEKSNNINALLFLLFLIFGMIGAVWSTWAYSDMFLPEPSSEHGVWIRNMFFWTLVATVPVFFITHVLLFWFSFKYKKDKTKASYYFPHSTKLELIWTLIPAIVLVFLVVEGLRNWIKITGPAPQEAMLVEATGQQFAWTLRYAGEDNKLGTKTVKLIGGDNAMGQVWEDKDNHDDFITTELHLPVDKPVLIKINALDVLHSFYLPHFRVKMDAVPGIPTQFWFTPTKTTQQMRDELGDPNFNYELACAELCGQAHFNMRRVVVVESAKEFAEWKKSQEPTYKALGLDKSNNQQNNHADNEEQKEADKDKSLSEL